MALEVDTRKAHLDDTTAIIELWKRFMTEEHQAVTDEEPLKNLEKWSEWLHSRISKGHIFIVKCNGVIVGFAAFVDSEEHKAVPSGIAYITDIYVIPEARKSKTACKVFNLLIEEASRAGFKEAWANTSVKNRRIQLLLKRAGFVDMDDFKLPHRKEDIHFKKALAT